MKRLLWMFIATVAFTSVTNAQSKWGEDSVKCKENLLIYYELAKAKSYDEAYEPWRYCYDFCPGCSKNNFIYGTRIVSAKIKAAPEAEKDTYIKLLMELYDNRLVYFPGKEAYVYERKAMDMAKHWPDSNETSFKIFEKALELSNKHSAAFYNAYFIVSARLFNKKVFDIGDVFNAYNVVQEGLDFNNNELNKKIKVLKEKQEGGTITDKESKELAKAEKELERFDKVSANNEKIVGKIATCDKLKLIYNQETFDANKGDVVWLRRAATMLSKEREDEEGETVDCTDNPIFFSIAEALHAVNPSPVSARAVGTEAKKNKNYSDAIKYFTEAAQGEIDPKKQATDYLNVASFYQKQGRLADAKNAAVKAANLRKNWGKPYLIIASVYAQADGKCGTNVFEKKAVYWAAIDKLNYAKSIDASVARTADRLIAAYKKQLPDKSTIFQLGIKEGDKHTIGCFVNETITVSYK